MHCCRRKENGSWCQPQMPEPLAPGHWPRATGLLSYVDWGLCFPVSQGNSWCLLFSLAPGGDGVCGNECFYEFVWSHCG